MVSSSDNSQNTDAGTATGEAWFDPNGNPFLAALSGLSNVVNTGFDAVSSFQDRLATLKATKKAQDAPPAQTTPAYNVNSVAAYVSDPANIKNIAIFGAGAFVLIFILRKVFK